MSYERHTIDLYILMTERSEFVVYTDFETARERAEDEFPDEDVRQISLTIELRLPSAHPEPLTAKCRLD